MRWKRATSNAASPPCASAVVKPPPSPSSASFADRVNGCPCGRRERCRSPLSSQPASSWAGAAAGLKRVVAARLIFLKANASTCRTRSPEMDSSRPSSLEARRILAEPPRLEHASLPAGQHIKGRMERSRLLRAFILFGDDRLRRSGE